MMFLVWVLAALPVAGALIECLTSGREPVFKPVRHIASMMLNAGVLTGLVLIITGVWQ